MAVSASLCSTLGTPYELSTDGARSSDAFHAPTLTGADRGAGSTSRIASRGQTAGGFASTRRTARSMKCPAITGMEEFLDAYAKAAGVGDDARSRSSASRLARRRQLSARPVLRGDVWGMVRRRALGAGIETAIGHQTFRATGITDYLTNGGRIEVAQRMAGNRTRKPAFTTGATTTSASARSRRSGFDGSIIFSHVDQKRNSRSHWRSTGPCHPADLRFLR